MTPSSAQDRITTLVLAGTGEARLVIDELCADGRFAITASLAGATDAPASLGVPCISGGFGGADGLAAWCRANGVQLIIDMTHPYAATMSANAALAAGRLGIASIRHERPPWHMKPGDNWRRFAGWREMAQAIPSGANVFLAGGSSAITHFAERGDIGLVARAMRDRKDAPPKSASSKVSSRITFIKAMPKSDVSEERRLLEEHDISIVCCKDSGGKAGYAKIEAARALGIEVWLLERPVGAGAGASAGGMDADGADGGGANAGGASAGGASAGGASAGGASADGSSAGGTDADGADASGADAGGAEAIRADAGGADAGGADASGADADASDRAQDVGSQQEGQKDQSCTMVHDSVEDVVAAAHAFAALRKT